MKRFPKATHHPSMLTGFDSGNGLKPTPVVDTIGGSGTRHNISSERGRETLEHI